MLNFSNRPYGWADLDLGAPFRAPERIMNSPGKTMKDVVAELRRGSVGALLELFELDVALGEVTLAAQSVAAAVQQMADEAQGLVRAPQLATGERLETLATCAKVASTITRAQLAALTELRSEVAGWGISPAPRHPSARD